MQTLTLEITDNMALQVLKDLQEKRFIKILAKPNPKSFVFPGKPLSVEEFQDMIVEAENSGTLSLKEAKELWANQRKKLLKLAR